MFSDDRAHNFRDRLDFNLMTPRYYEYFSKFSKTILIFTSVESCVTEILKKNFGCFDKDFRNCEEKFLKFSVNFETILEILGKISESLKKISDIFREISYTNLLRIFRCWTMSSFLSLPKMRQKG